MKHVRTFDSYRVIKNREEIIKESVLQVNDIYKVKTMVDIPQSLINSYVKKVKETTGNNLKQFFGDVDIAEEIVKYVTLNNTNIDAIPGGALMGGEEEVQDPVQPQAQTQPQVQPQAQVQAPAQVQPQAQVQAPAQVQPQAQIDPNAQVQPADDGQVQVQPADDEEINFDDEAQLDFDDAQAQVKAQSQDEEDDDEDDDEDELPL